MASHTLLSQTQQVDTTSDGGTSNAVLKGVLGWTMEFFGALVTFISVHPNYGFSDDSIGSTRMPGTPYELMTMATRAFFSSVDAIQNGRPLLYPLPEPLYPLAALMGTRCLVDQNGSVKINLNLSGRRMNETDINTSQVLALLGKEGFLAREYNMNVLEGLDYKYSGKSGLKPAKVFVADVTEAGKKIVNRIINVPLDKTLYAEHNIDNFTFYGGDLTRNELAFHKGINSLLPVIEIDDEGLDRYIRPRFPGATDTSYTRAPHNYTIANTNTRESAVQCADMVLNHHRNALPCLGGSVNATTNPGIEEDAAMAFYHSLLNTPFLNLGASVPFLLNPSAFAVCHLVAIAATKPHVLMKLIAQKMNSFNPDQYNMMSSIFAWLAQFANTCHVPACLSESVRTHINCCIPKQNTKDTPLLLFSTYLSRRDAPTPTGIAPRGDVLPLLLTELLLLLEGTLDAVTGRVEYDPTDVNDKLNEYRQVIQYVSATSCALGVNLLIAPSQSRDLNRTKISPRLLVETRLIDYSPTTPYIPTGESIRMLPQFDHCTGNVGVGAGWAEEYLRLCPVNGAIDGVIYDENTAGAKINVKYLMDQIYPDGSKGLDGSLLTPTTPAEVQQSFTALANRNYTDQVVQFMTKMPSSYKSDLFSLADLFRFPLFDQSSSGVDDLTLVLRQQGYNLLRGDGSDRRSAIAQASLVNRYTHKATTPSQMLLSAFYSKGGLGSIVGIIGSLLGNVPIIGDIVKGITGLFGGK